MSLFSLSSDGGVADMDLAGDFAGVVPSEESPPEAVVFSGFLLSLMVILSSIFVMLPCFTWVPLPSLVMVMSP